MARLPNLPFNEFDISGVTNTANEFKKAGLVADYDLSEGRTGVVRLITDNWLRSDGPRVLFEIHKLGKRGFLRVNAKWVIQLYSIERPYETLTKRGCSMGSYQMAAIHNAMRDVQQNFLSILDLEFACEAD